MKESFIDYSFLESGLYKSNICEMLKITTKQFDSTWEEYFADDKDEDAKFVGPTDSLELNLVCAVFPKLKKYFDKIEKRAQMVKASLEALLKVPVEVAYCGNFLRLITRDKFCKECYLGWGEKSFDALENESFRKEILNCLSKVLSVEEILSSKYINQVNISKEDKISIVYICDTRRSFYEK